MRPGSIAKAGLIHTNGNLLCAIDCETTGDKAGYHDLIQVCVLPLDYDLKPMKTILPFYTDIRPRRPENCSPELIKRNRERICDAMARGLDPDRGADLFDEWFEKLRLAPDKKIMPLAHNWPFDRGFILDWLGFENFNYRIHGHYRDSMAAALFMNDRNDAQGEQVQFARIGLSNVGSRLNIVNDNPHDALADCLACAEIYRQLIKKFV